MYQYPANRATKWEAKLIQVKGEMDESTIIAGIVNLSLSTTDRTNIYRDSKDTEEINNINWQDLILIFIECCTKQQQNTNSFQASMEYIPR